MAELGETQDPLVLVPGKPEAIEENARVLRGRAQAAGVTAEGLKAIDTGSAWKGSAAQAFREKFSYEPSRWFIAADALHAAAGSLDDYANTLRWAQFEAAEALAKWNQGESVTKQALAIYQVDLREASAQNQPAATFTDPGEQSRQAAREILSRARAQLGDVGDISAATLRDKTQHAPEESSWLDEIGDFLVDTGARAINTLASLGNAIVHHPGDLLGALGGLGVTLASGAGFIGGATFSATAAGAVVGVPAMAASAVGAAQGAAMMVAAMGDLASHATGDDHVEVIKTGKEAAPVPESPPAGVKEGWSSRPANNGKGTFWQKPGSAKNANSVRIMDKDANPLYPNGYVKFTNEHNQPIRLDARPGSDAETHIPRNLDGSYPLPEGW
jgi:hypothetical protein